MILLVSFADKVKIRGCRPKLAIKYDRYAAWLARQPRNKMRIAGPTPVRLRRKRTEQQAMKSRVWQNLVKPATLVRSASLGRVPQSAPRINGVLRWLGQRRDSLPAYWVEARHLHSASHYGIAGLRLQPIFYIWGKTWPAGNSVIPTSAFVPRNTEGHDDSGDTGAIRTDPEYSLRRHWMFSPPIFWRRWKFLIGWYSQHAAGYDASTYPKAALLVLFIPFPSRPRGNPRGI